MKTWHWMRTIVGMVALYVTVHSPVVAQTLDTVWLETWEGNPDTSWSVSGGSWEWGLPRSGPPSAHQGEKCAATVLAGNYSEPVDSRMTRFRTFRVPSRSQNPRVRFWHWFNFTNGDTGFVEIRIGIGQPRIVSVPYVWTGSGVWSFASIDLSAFADSTVSLSFYFKARAISPFGDVSTGWYIDEIYLLTGAYTLRNPEGWENGIGDWFVERGVWEVGRPTSRPDSAFAGRNCAGTVLSGNYSEPAETRLISPPFWVPRSSPRVSFRQWFDLANGDTGFAQIRTLNGSWQHLGDTVRGPNTNWSLFQRTLDQWADSMVQLAFYFKARAISPFGDVSTGWSIDSLRLDPTVSVNAIEVSSPTYFALSQNYPNPFNPSTKISFSIPTTTFTTLKVFDILGKEVATLVNEELKPGSFETTWDASGFASGVYLYRLSAGSFVASRKLLLLR